MTVKVTIPLKTISEANKAEHWFIKAKRHKMQKNAVALCLRSKLEGIRLPCKIKVTRIAPRKLDSHDNLRMSQKFVIDQIAELIKPNMVIGRADDDAGFHFEYDQRRGEVKEYAIEVEIENL